MPNHHHPTEQDWWKLENDKLHEMRRIVDELKCICKALQPPVAHDFRLVQLKGDWSMPINGVQVGGSGVFQASLIPANAAPLQSGPTFSTDDPNVSLTPDPANPFNTTATVATGDTNASFNLTVAGVNSAGTAITHTFAIPIIAAPPPAAVDFDLTQLS